MTPKQIEHIENIVEHYANSQGLIPQGMRLVIKISLEPQSAVQVIDRMQSYDPKVLDLNPSESVTEYCKSLESPEKHRAIRICNIFYAAKYLTIREVVLAGTDSTRGIDKYWTAHHRGCGQKSISVIDEWLESLGLRRGMRF